MALKLLIAGGNPAGQEKICRSLESNKLHIFSANTVRSALTLLDRKNIDFIVAELITPGMDGLQLCRWIKSSHDFRHIPSILCSDVLIRPTDEDLALTAGADRFIPHPLSSDETIEAIRFLAKDLKNGRYVPRLPESAESAASAGLNLRMPLPTPAAILSFRSR